MEIADVFRTLGFNLVSICKNMIWSIWSSHFSVATIVRPSLKPMWQEFTKASLTGEDRSDFMSSWRLAKHAGGLYTTTTIATIPTISKTVLEVETHGK